MVAILEIKIFHNLKTNIMWYIIIGFIASIIWIAYEMYTAPHGEETKEGFRVTKPGKKISDLWRKQS